MKTICEILKESKTIAVIGISDKPGRASRRIALSMRDKGYNVVGVHPVLKNVENISVYKSITEIPVDIDIVDVFIRSEIIFDIIPEVLAKRPKVLWLQMGIQNDEAVKPIIEAGIDVIQDKCIAVEYRTCYSLKKL